MRYSIVIGLVAVALAVAAGLLGRGANEVRACSFAATNDPVAGSNTIVYGRVIEVVPGLPPEFAETPDTYQTVTMEVYSVLKGAPQPSRLAAVVAVADRRPGIPDPCPYFRFDSADELLGRTLVAGINPSVSGTPMFGFASSWLEGEPWTSYPGQWRLAQFLRPEAGPPTPVIGTKVLFPAPLIDAEVEPGTTWAQRIGEVRVYADGIRCGAIRLDDPAARDANNEATFEFGLGGQPAACSRTGALVCLDHAAVGNQAAYVFNQKFELVPGSHLIMRSLGPDTPHDPRSCALTASAPLPPDAGSGFPDTSRPAPLAWWPVLISIVIGVGRARGKSGVAPAGNRRA